MSRRRSRLVIGAVMVGLLATACGTTRTSIALSPGRVEFIEHRTFMSTTPIAVVYDQQDRIVGVAAGSGTSPAAVGLGIAQAGAMVGAAGLVANGLGKLTRIQTTTSGTVETTGTLQLLAPAAP